MRIIVGLGNPGEQYENSRHNVGFIFVDALAGKLNLTWRYNKKFKAAIAENDEVLLVKPLTFMNDSGRAVAGLFGYFKLSADKQSAIKNTDLSTTLTVVHDDLDIEFGYFKISADSRSAGHKGVQSIIDHLKTKKFKRLRIGIKKTIATKAMPIEIYVLQKFDAAELAVITELIKKLINDQAYS